MATRYTLIHSGNYTGYMATGPTGPAGPTGPTGYTGPTGAVPTKATQTDVATGTDDTKYTTSLAVSPLANQSMYQQAIINGNFDVWQRGTTFTNVLDTKYTADLWIVYKNNTAVFDILSTQDCPTVAESGTYSRNCLNFDVTTADASIAAGEQCGIVTRLEGTNIKGFGFGQSGTRYITLSFWVKSTKTGIFCIALGNNSFNRSYVAEYTVLSSDTWEKKVITIPVDTTGTWEYGAGDFGLAVTFTLAAGSTYQTTANTWANGFFMGTANQVNALDSASNFFKLSQVQLCAGSVALPFQPKSFAEELRACQRYCYGITTSNELEMIGTGIAASTTVAYCLIPFQTRMRVSEPTVTVTAADWKIGNNTGAGIDVTVLAIDDTHANSANQGGLKVTVASGLTAGGSYNLFADGGGARTILFNAEF